MGMIAKASSKCAHIYKKQIVLVKLDGCEHCKVHTQTLIFIYTGRTSPNEHHRCDPTLYIHTMADVLHTSSMTWGWSAFHWYVVQNYAHHKVLFYCFWQNKNKSSSSFSSTYPRLGRGSGLMAFSNSTTFFVILEGRTSRLPDILFCVLDIARRHTTSPSSASPRPVVACFLQDSPQVYRGGGTCTAVKIMYTEGLCACVFALCSEKHKLKTKKVWIYIYTDPFMDGGEREERNVYTPQRTLGNEFVYWHAVCQSSTSFVSKRAWVVMQSILSNISLFRHFVQRARVVMQSILSNTVFPFFDISFVCLFVRATSSLSSLVGGHCLSNGQCRGTNLRT